MAWCAKCEPELHYYLFIIYMKTRREIQKEKMLAKYKAIYKDAQSGMSFSDIAKKYGYKNAGSARTQYFQTVLKVMRSL